MREFVVTLRCGLKFVVKADRVSITDRQFLALLVTLPDGPDLETAALFDRAQVFAVVAKDLLVSEVQSEPLAGYITRGDGDDIPF